MLYQEWCKLRSEIYRLKCILHDSRLRVIDHFTPRWAVEQMADARRQLPALELRFAEVNNLLRGNGHNG